MVTSDFILDLMHCSQGWALLPRPPYSCCTCALTADRPCLRPRAAVPARNVTFSCY
jgi:hypothetical protein